MIIVTAEHIAGARMGLQDHPGGISAPGERVRGMADPGRDRWADPERVLEAMWAIGRDRG